MGISVTSAVARSGLFLGALSILNGGVMVAGAVCVLNTYVTLRTHRGFKCKVGFGLFTPLFSFPREVVKDF